jgi:hypothetical protein
MYNTINEGIGVPNTWFDTDDLKKSQALRQQREEET